MAMPKPCHKHAKIHANVCSGKNTYQSQERQIEGKQGNIFSSDERAFVAFWVFPEQGSTEFGRVKR